MPQIREIHLDISNPDRSIEFYVDRLGMRLVSETAGSYSLACQSGAQLKLRHRTNASGYHERDSDAYWKIGITIADVDVARERLNGHNIDVTESRQFFDIGYLCHLEDPDGYWIELLQHRFESNHKPASPIESEPLGNVPVIGQVSLNVSSIDQSLAFYSGQLGFKLISRQRVPGRGFTLYFLGDAKLQPPSADVDALENREWLWQLPKTVLELRAFEIQAQKVIPHPPESELGFRGIGIESPTLNSVTQDPDGVCILRQL
ncbi:MAG: VOC family protein [Verrucomicrobiota bacterium]